MTPDDMEALPFRTLDQLAELDGVEYTWAWEHYIAASALTLLVSRPKVGKSTLACGLVGAIRRQQSFLGLETGRNVGVLYLTEETNPVSLRAKLLAAGVEPGDPGVAVLRRVDVYEERWADVAARLHQHAKAFKEAGGFAQVLVIVDVLGAWAGFEEGSEQDSGATRAAIEKLGPLARDGFAVLILHHAGWSGKRSRGSSGIVGAVDVCLFLDGEAGSHNPRAVEYQGGRLDTGSTPARVNVTMDHMGQMTALAQGRRNDVARKLATVVNVVRELGSVTDRDIAERMGVSERTAERYLQELVGSEQLRRHDEMDHDDDGRITGRQVTYTIEGRDEYVKLMDDTFPDPLRPNGEMDFEALFGLHRGETGAPSD
ncbi:MAG: AAA family ATPase [Actinomycetota bacterium]